MEDTNMHMFGGGERKQLEGDAKGVEPRDIFL
jgi:hypothetical protein